MMSHILAIDQGTTSSRVIVYDEEARPVFTAQEEFPQYYPGDGLVEHDAQEIWTSVVSCLKQALRFTRDIAAIGITNQRETTVVWDRRTGAPVHRAIVWQDRRTAPLCARLKADGCEGLIVQKTGLLLDPYFSGTKIAWILDHVAGARARAERGELAFGTIDSWLIWRLTGGRVHATDATNASRTLLYNINTDQWDAELLALFDIPKSLLPEVRDCADDFGVTDKGVIGADIPICGVAGDQQAAAIGQGCFAPGEIKSTYGTGCFVLLNTGGEKLTSQNRLLSTIAYRLDGQTAYALEGSIFNAGTTVQWLRDGLGIIKTAAETE
ncbi:MAG TPA: glycerol kinase, partial [Hellea balneolensis]|nr:glycerol kinase [Hellea balneolensis]